MIKTKILSFLMSMALLLSTMSFTGFAFGHNNDAGLFSEMYSQQDSGKSLRTVYLHAQGVNPTVTPNVSTVYMGDTADIYFAVDNPNKGDYDASVQEEPLKHLEPHYDLNGYTIKIYFDPAFFALVNDPSAPIDYTVPDVNIEESGSDKEEVGSGEDKEEVDNTPQKPGYFPYKHGSTGTVVINGKSYRSAYATIFFSGSWLPMEKEPLDDEGNPIPAWYNLAKLPLTPLKTGNTEVFIDVDGADEYTLELFAKNTSDEFSQTFLFDTEYGGHHQIIIKDKLKPDPPVATPDAGKYIDTQFITLEAEEGCDIYYSMDGGNTVYKYVPGEKIKIERTSEIETYAKRIADNRYSNTVTYKYQIVPKAPVLYDSADTTILLPNIHRESQAFSVLVSENTPYSNIADQNEIFYTFGTLELDENLTDEDKDPDPSTEWVKLPKATQSISIETTETVRLYTRNMLTGEVSDVSVYYLLIKPEAVESSHKSGTYDKKIEVELTTKTEGAQIYYTTDQSDPIVNGILYDPEIPLALYKDTTIRAVAKYDGVYSDITSFYYIFTMSDDFGVDAFYPSGVYEGSVNVTIIPHDPEKDVLISTDNGKTWKPEKSLVVDTDTHILAKAVDSDGNEGAPYTFIYKIKPLAPQFAPESTQFTSTDKVTVYTPESLNSIFTSTTHRFDLYYTLDGTSPITSATRIHADEESDSATITINDYTVISAVVLKDGENNSNNYSNIVTHAYDVVTTKPATPVPTLAPGFYTHEIGGSPYSTQFLPTTGETQIYYTICYDGTYKKDPTPGDEETKPYDGNPINIEGHTIIKAIAINDFGVKSDIGIFEYIVTPEAPIASPGGSVSGDKLPIVMVNAVAGSTVKYEIGEGDEKFENEFKATDEIFYIDTNTGNAYLDPDCTMGLGKENAGTISSPAILHIKAELDGIESEPNTYIYSLSNNENYLASPFPDKYSGTYEEIAVFEDEGDESTVLGIKLYTLNSGDTIQYKFDTDDAWTDYDGDYVKLTGDTVLLIRSKKDESYSPVTSYVYNFVPLPPVITLPAGTYSTQFDTPKTRIEFDSRAPGNKLKNSSGDDNYYIFYRADNFKKDIHYNVNDENVGDELEINNSMSLNAYVYSKETNRISQTITNSYTIENPDATSGNVYIATPYDVSRISAHVLSTGEYANGIKLLTNNKNAIIRYRYIYHTVDGKKAETSDYTFDSAAPIFVNGTMEDITIIAWLLDKDETEIENSERIFYIDFIHLKVPLTSLALANPTKIEYEKYTSYYLINDYEGDDTYILYYTLDGSDPSDPENPAREAYTGTEDDFVLTNETTVKAVYFSACDDDNCDECSAGNYKDCPDGVYGKVQTYFYNVPTKVVGGGGGGGSTVTERKYTYDHFGFEHPTHVNYINGYPDGSVQADGHITREEMAAILYRVKNKQYEEPFKTTGEVFPDVDKTRWSVTDIEYMAAHGVIKGYPEGDFKPCNNLTRAEFAALIRRFTALPASKDANVFPDLSQEHWAFDDIMALYSAGFLNGYEDGTVRPENQITRAEVMKVMNIILGRKPDVDYVKSLKVAPFNDLDKTKWYYVDVLEATITHNYFLDKNGYEYKWEDIR